MDRATVWSAYRKATDHWAEACMAHGFNLGRGHHEIAEQERDMIARWRRLIDRCEHRLDAPRPVYRWVAERNVERLGRGRLVVWDVTFYREDIGWFAGHEGWPFIAGSLAYCLGVLQEMERVK